MIYFVFPDKVILFLTDGIPTDDEISIYRNLSNLNAQQHNEVVLLTYFLSTCKYITRLYFL